MNRRVRKTIEAIKIENDLRIDELKKFAKGVDPEFFNQTILGAKLKVAEAFRNLLDDMLKGQ